MPVTQKQIANELGISHQLVSFALNGNGNVAPKTREEIVATAERLGYRRNELARAIVTGKSRVVAVLTHEYAREHLASMLSGTLGEITKQGYAAKILHLPFDEKDAGKLAPIVQRCTEWRVDGVIALSLQSHAIECLTAELGRNQCPVVCVEGAPASCELTIHTDDESGINEALDHLQSLGHERIGLVSGPQNEEVSQRRAKIFQAALYERHLPLEATSVVWGHWFDMPTMEAAIAQILDARPAPTALLCLSDSMAMVAMRVARNRGLQVPRDLSVIGYGNSSHCAYFDPSLSSIAQPFHQMGQLGARRLLAQIELGGGDSEPDTNLRERLIVRASTAPLSHL